MSSKDNRILFNRERHQQIDETARNNYNTLNKEIIDLTNKHNQEFAELKKYVSDGKNLLAATLAANWITWASATDKFEIFSENIKLILDGTNATQAQVLATTGAENTGNKIYFSSKTAGINENGTRTGIRLHGTMTNHTGWFSENEITTGTTLSVTIPEGYHKNGYVQVDTTKAYNNGKDAGYAQGVTDTKKGNATKAQVLSGCTFTSSSAGVGVEGEMPNKHAWKGPIVVTGKTTATTREVYKISIPAGYHNGSGYVYANADDAIDNARRAGYDDGLDAGKPSKSVSIPMLCSNRGESMNAYTTEINLTNFKDNGFNTVSWTAFGGGHGAYTTLYGKNSSGNYVKVSDKTSIKLSDYSAIKYQHNYKGGDGAYTISVSINP